MTDRERFSFEPGFQFHPVHCSDDILVTWEELYPIIPERIDKLLEGMGL